MQPRIQRVGLEVVVVPPLPGRAPLDPRLHAAVPQAVDLSSDGRRNQVEAERLVERVGEDFPLRPRHRRVHALPIPLVLSMHLGGLEDRLAGRHRPALDPGHERDAVRKVKALALPLAFVHLDERRHLDLLGASQREAQRVMLKCVACLAEQRLPVGFAAVEEASGEVALRRLHGGNRGRCPRCSAWIGWREGSSSPPCAQ